MAKMIPELLDHELEELDSAAEGKVYRSLRDQLSDDYVVFFRVAWILRREQEQARDGEADFIVCHPARGYLSIEVKGGGVAFDAISGDWFSIDRFQKKHPIKNPIGQAQRAKYSVLTKLSEHPGWESHHHGNVIRGHAVFFPDIGNARALLRPDLPEALIGTEASLLSARKWVEQVFQYWSNQDPTQKPLGRKGVDMMSRVFARSFEVRPLVSSRLREQEERRLRLTRDQLRVLDLLRCQRRAAVSGGAGTGKTVLAVEKAKRLAADGFRTLLTCYNRQLADHLAEVCAGTPGLDVMSFHQLCHWRIERANALSNRDLLAEAKLTYPGVNLYDVQFPLALAYTAEVLPDQYGAIVCDEGQDFREEYWLPVELLLSDYRTSPLYVFFDDNQNIYARVSTFPIQTEPFSLITNCRNTDPIHQVAYRYYRGTPIDPPGNPGDEVQHLEGAGLDQQAMRLHANIVHLIANERVSPSAIAVLIVDSQHKQDFYRALIRRPLPRPAVWGEEVNRTSQTVLLDTVQRFKGLEADVVFLWGLDGIDPGQHQELMYVGISRAKSYCCIVGQPETCRSLLL